MREISVNLSKQVQEDYLAYSMSVILGRAIPRLTDGCKPISRRILTAMKMLNLKPDGKYMKSARVEGEVMGKYSPHGSSYGSIVTLASPWNNLIPLVDGHGNWGSSTNSAAASRYTEAKLSGFSWECLLDDSDTWETLPNYDGSLQEPVELNVKIPHVLLNGQEGIGVGYACRIPPHSLRSIVEALKLICKDGGSEKSRLDNLEKARMALIPDFPTGVQIIEDEQLQAYRVTGSGNIRCMAKVEEGVQKRGGRAKDRPTLSFTCLPFGTNPEKLGEQIRNEVEKGRIDGIAEVNDMSDMSGDCLEIVAKPGANLGAIKNQLYLYTDLETKYSAKTLVIDGMKPVELSPVTVIQKWIPWRLSRLQAKFENELYHKNSRLHIVDGLLKAINKMDAIIKKIRSAKDKSEAKASLMAGPFKFSDRQAEAILEMRLRQLTNLDQSDLTAEGQELRLRITDLETLSGDTPEGLKRRKEFMLKELSVIDKKFGETRRSPVLSPPTDILSTVSDKTKSDTRLESKPRFLKIDSARGIVQQVKGPRGAFVIDSRDKVILMTGDGMLKKVGSNFKGAISSGYCPVSLAKKESDVENKKYLVIFELDSQVRAMVLVGEDLCKTTSKGKRWLPEGGRLLHFGEGPYTIRWTSSRRKPLTLNLDVKSAKPGGKGIKVAETREVLISG